MSENTDSESKLLDLWRFFASVRLTVILLLTLAITSIIGTLIPQNADPAAYLRTYGEFLFRFFDLLGFYDVYHSWWFRLFLLLLTINVVVCSVERLRATWKIIFVRNPNFNIARFRRLKSKAEFIDSRQPDELKAVVERVVSRGFGYKRVESSDSGFYAFAEKWRLTRLGVYIVHLSVLFLLMGGLIGSIFGFEGYVNIPEGETVNSIRLIASKRIHALDFQIRCDDFNVAFYQNGTPKEFRSQLTILEQGRPVLQKDILVNDPLRYKGINIFQSSYGQLPLRPEDLKLPEEIPLNITSKTTGMIYKKKAKIGQPLRLPENLGTLVINEFKPNFNFRGTKLGETFTGWLEQPDGSRVEIILPVRFPSFDRMGPMIDPRRTDAVFLALADVQLPQQQIQARYYTGLQVTKDPGVWVVYVGFIAMLLGCFVTFFMSHQQICVEVTRRGEKSEIMVAGTANKNKLGMQRKVEKIAEILSKM